eukprot:TRINITY_DN357_c0_g1_i1.p1 TRINITY_DN357_c0_g1~~TRINITY_DN357_c0_g1_i1.p1  ORF type:complete len:1129 (-),score=242.08 TRINITY_DN357_c0_g1_i1:382-3768(-)
MAGTLPLILQNAASKFGDRSALIVMDGGPQLSYSELEAAVEAVAGQLRALGVQPGKMVSLAFPNTLEFVVAFLAVTRVRATAAPLNAAYTEEEFRFFMEDVESSLLLLPAQSPAVAAAAAAALLKVPVATVHALDGKKGIKVELSEQGASSDTPNGHASMDAGPQPTGEETALFLHTSGTTSRPKGVPLTHANLATSIGNISATYALGPEDKTLIVMPLFHVHGLMAALLSTLATGGTVLLPAGGRFSASTFWLDMRTGGATWYTAVPTIHQILLARHKDGRDRPPEGYPSLRFIRSCSASLAPATLAGLEDAFHAPVLEAYAMTEASHQMCSNPLPINGPHKPGSVGKPTGIELAILDDKGNVRPSGETGEVCIRGKNVTAGYRNNPAANEKEFAFGWFHTGDQGRLDADGYLELTGRLKELINRGGEKVSPLEVDAAMLAHPAVAEAVAFAAPDSHYGEQVNAAIVLHTGQTATEDDIKAFLSKQLATFKIPKKIFFANQVPRTATGKIQRRFVAEAFLQGAVKPAVAAAPSAQAATTTATPPQSNSTGPPVQEIDGNDLLARSLARMGIRHMFGVVGIPVTQVATSAQKAGVRFIAFRNEQAAGYAAGAAGFLTGLPGALLTVSGPGCVHGLAGCSNAMVNAWPLVMISGSCTQADVGRGDFQELDQIQAVKPFVKSAGKATSISLIPSIVETAAVSSVSGRPGAAYIDIPSDVLHQKISLPQAEELLNALHPIIPSWAASKGSSPYPPLPPLPSSESLSEAVALLKSAQKPLLVFGKGAAYSRADEGLTKLVEATGIPFLATPMGKGVLPDSHPLSASAARSLALSEADVAVVVGARLNWILHFGEPPRWSSDVKFILVEVDGEEVEKRKPTVGLVGDARSIVFELTQRLEEANVKLGDSHPWVGAIKAKARINTQKMAANLARDVVPFNFLCPLRLLKEAIQTVGSPVPILVSEGANTMDIGRTVLDQEEPRSRLDAGTWGTMGVGMGYAIAAAVTQPGRLVVALEGDSAFGFSAIEVETIVRYNLPIIVVVMNNGGVYGGDRRGPVELPSHLQTDPAPTSFVEGARYHHVIEAFGGKGYSAATPDELSAALKEAFATKKPALINVVVDPFAGTESGGMTHRN